MTDYLLLGGVALGILSIIVAVLQLLQTRPPRAAAIILVLAIVALLSGAYLSPRPFGLAQLCDAWTRVTGGSLAQPQTGGPDSATGDAATGGATP